MGTEVFAPTHVRLFYNGLVQWATLAIIRATCQVSMHNFPFDYQICTLTMGSWTQDASKLDFHVESDQVILDSYVENGEWDLIGMSAASVYEMYPSSPYPFSLVIYTVEIERRPLFYLFNMILPVILLLVVGILAFCLSPHTGQKIQLTTTVLLTMMLFQLMLSEMLPPTSDSVPLLSMLCRVHVVPYWLCVVLH